MIQDNVNMTDTVSFNKVCLPVKKLHMFYQYIVTNIAGLQMKNNANVINQLRSKLQTLCLSILSISTVPFKKPVTAKC